MFNLFEVKIHPADEKISSKNTRKSNHSFVEVKDIHTERQLSIIATDNRLSKMI